MSRSFLVLFLSLSLTTFLLPASAAGDEASAVEVVVLKAEDVQDGISAVTRSIGVDDLGFNWPTGVAKPREVIETALDELPEDHIFSIEPLTAQDLEVVLNRAPLLELSRPAVRRTVLAMNGLAVVIDHFADGSGVDTVVSLIDRTGESRLEDYVHAAHLDVRLLGDETVMTVTTSAGDEHTAVADSAVTPCKDICNEFNAGTSLIGVTTCGIIGFLGSPAAGIACGVAWIGVGTAASNFCDDHYGAAHVGCEPTDGRGAVLWVPQCDTTSCTLDMVLRDRNANLHNQSAYVDVWWAMDGTFANFSWTQHNYNVDRLDAGTFFSVATYQGRTRTLHGSPSGFVECTTVARIMVAWSGGPYLRTDALKPGTGEVGCTYSLSQPELALR